MKRYLLFTLLLIPGFLIFAQNISDLGIPYQAVVRDNNGIILYNQPAIFRFSMIDLAGDTVLVDEHVVNTGGLGRVELYIGEGVNTSGSVELIDWTQGPFTLKIDLNIGNGWLNMGSEILHPVLAAKYAETSGDWTKSNQNIYRLNGNVGLGTTTPLVRLHIEDSTDVSIGSTTRGGIMIGRVNNFNLAMDQNEIMARYNGTKSHLMLQAEGGDLRIHSAPGTQFIVRDDGKVGIGTLNPSRPLHVHTASKDQGLRISTTGFSESIYLHLAESGDGIEYGYLHLGGDTKLRGNGKTSVFDGMVEVNCLKVKGGCDITEPFEISENQILPAGSVVVIDEANPGKLTLCNQAYDRRVAGIISGAGDIQPGLTLTQEGLMDNGQQVALAGRVYVRASAENGPIHPGDRLTTSNLPGYGMKVTDPGQAFGAVIGKAMSTLENGEGLVLVLVSLQ